MKNKSENRKDSIGEAIVKQNLLDSDLSDAIDNAIEDAVEEEKQAAEKLATEKKASDKQKFVYNTFLYTYVNEYLKCNQDSLVVFLEHLDTTFNAEFMKEVISIGDTIKQQIFNKH